MTKKIAAGVFFASLVILVVASRIARQRARRGVLLRRCRAVLAVVRRSRRQPPTRPSGQIFFQERRRQGVLVQPRAPRAHEDTVRSFVATVPQVRLSASSGPSSRRVSREAPHARAARRRDRVSPADDAAVGRDDHARVLVRRGAVARRRSRGGGHGALRRALLPRRGARVLRRADRRDVGRRRVRVLARTREPTLGDRLGRDLRRGARDQAQRVLHPAGARPSLARHRTQGRRRAPAREEIPDRAAPAVVDGGPRPDRLPRVLAVAVVLDDPRASASTSRSTCTMSITTSSTSA